MTSFVFRQAQSPESSKSLQPTAMHELEQMADHLVNLILPAHRKGGTWNPRAWELADFGPDIYVVSLYGYEQRHASTPSSSQLLTWLIQTSKFWRDPAYFIGWYYDHSTEEFVLDVSCLCWTLTAAIQIAIVCFQDAIYHPASKQIIPIDRAAWFKLHFIEKPAA